MRKAAVFTLFLSFLALQYGHMLSYLYCKWQAEMVLHQNDCGCEDQLAAAYNAQPESDTLLPPLANSQVITLYQEEPLLFSFSVPLIVTIPSSESRSSLAEGFHAAPFHPPTV